MMVLGLYKFHATEKPTPKKTWSAMPPSSVRATADSWDRANHFRVG